MLDRGECVLSQENLVRRGTRPGCSDRRDARGGDAYEDTRTVKSIVNAGLNCLLNEAIRVRSDWFWTHLPHGPEPEVAASKHRWA